MQQWPPVAAEQSECANCGESVSDSFSRVFGDNRDVVHACTSCATYREIKETAGGRR